MNVVLVHPVHGAKIATAEVEIKNDEKNGWVRYTSDTPIQVAPEIEDKPKRKFQRRVSEQSIEQPKEALLP